MTALALLLLLAKAAVVFFLGYVCGYVSGYRVSADTCRTRMEDFQAEALQAAQAEMARYAEDLRQAYSRN